MSAGLGVKGWPREFIDSTITTGYTGAYPARPVEVQQRRPNIWLGGQKQAVNDWLSFDDKLIPEANTGNVCVVCGEPFQRLLVFGHTWKFGTNGPPAHPRCFAMALKFCPRFTKAPYTRKRQTVAYVHDRGDALVTELSKVLAYPESVTSDYGLKPRAVRAFNRARMVALAKSDPLGAGEIT